MQIMGEVNNDKSTQKFIALFGRNREFDKRYEAAIRHLNIDI